jgi:hypothetical protein
MEEHRHKAVVVDESHPSLYKDNDGTPESHQKQNWCKILPECEK